MCCCWNFRGVDGGVNISKVESVCKLVTVYNELLSEVLVVNLVEVLVTKFKLMLVVKLVKDYNYNLGLNLCQ